MSPPPSCVSGADKMAQNIAGRLRAMYGPGSMQPFSLTSCSWPFHEEEKSSVKRLRCRIPRNLTQLEVKVPRSSGKFDKWVSLPLASSGHHFFLIYPRFFMQCCYEQEAMEIKHEDKEMKRFLKTQFGECNALVKLIEATPPHQIHRRRIEVFNSGKNALCLDNFRFAS